MQLFSRANVLAALIILGAIGYTASQMLNPSGKQPAPAAVAPPASVPHSTALPDFSTYTDVKAKKTAFFCYMLPLVEARNLHIQGQRQQLLAVAERAQDVLSTQDTETLADLAGVYRLVDADLSSPELIKELLIRVDTVPPSLALAQAAVESGWGTSRFAVQANNLFGQWCYEKGCGLVPNQRNSGANHEVAKFNNVSDAVYSYTRNINTHRAYKDLRMSRAALRANDETVTGHILAEGLLRYSERGEDYVHELQAVIRINKLASYDEPKAASSKGSI
ncbi:glucosaminidase domain-containing protein [Pseudomonadales bacterium]|nr:glucosaminidase domain-containing protein [Pseudomonadales bacterium]